MSKVYWRLPYRFGVHNGDPLSIFYWGLYCALWDTIGYMREYTDEQGRKCATYTFKNEKLKELEGILEWLHYAGGGEGGGG